ncbi:Pentatricopeptide repeat-containing protein [Raphanus sativus]|uniref:Pentatricopeptide repeat-containing protein At1g09820-like n=1 Tax=Raphanus sativus TaxID=3726 RepID=A0A9W3D0M4_RAPSA|nr:pentatricopeptide repeat-containing protein At1g09820-like [Raphanus sativus]KAJ4866679.1 Pentatricopeptide repeat-containing protein [Raphanus sativus]
MFIKSFAVRRKLSRLSRLCSSYSATTITNTPYPPRDDVALIADLIEKQHWPKLRLHVKDTNPNELFHQLISSNLDPDLCLRYYTWLATNNHRNISLSLELTFKLLHSLANAKRYSKIRSFLDGFVKKRSEHSVHSILHAISLCDNLCVNSILADMLVLAYANNSRFELALEAFKRAGYYGYKLSSLSCKPLMVALLKEKRFADVEFVYREMIRRRIQPDVFAFNVVINSFCKRGKMSKAKDVMEDMKVYGASPPDVVSYNTLIDGYCKLGGMGKMYKADGVLKEMVESEVSPNLTTFNILIDGFWKDGNYSGSMKVFKEMLDQDVKPNVVTYNSLINGLCSVGKVSEATCMHDKMVSAGVQPDLITYNSLINGFCKNGMMKEALDMFASLKGRGIVPTATTYNMLIDAYCKSGKVEDGFKVKEEMEREGIVPNVETYNCLIGGLCRNGNMEAAKKLFDQLSSKGLPDLVTYHILMDGYCRKGETRKAAMLLREGITKMGLKPRHLTYNILMEGYCKEGNLKGAGNVRIQMEKERRLRMNVASYNVLLQGYSQKGKMEEANRLLNEMLEKGLIPNRITYEIVKAEMVDKGFVPDIEGHLFNVSTKS